MDLHRAFAYLVTQGADGMSPHLSSDLITLLRARGYVDARLTSVGFSPINLKIALSHDTTVFVSQSMACDNAPGQIWFFVTKDNKTMVRVNAGRVVEVPYAIADEEANVFSSTSVFTHNWRTSWPTLAEAQEFDYNAPTPGYQKFFSRVKDAPMTPIKYAHYVYVSERAIVDAIDLIVHTPH
jgi:hypothetical protein